MIDRFELREAGDAALLLRLRAAIDPAINDQAIAIATALRRAAPPGVRDVVSTYHSVAIHFDPLITDHERIQTLMLDAVAAPPAALETRAHEMPVVYGGSDGPDLQVVASGAALAPADVVARHAGVAYRVYMIGFQPGFPYLGMVDPSIATPRRTTPRLRVPAGSVGIAGRQTGIYPAESPGGWQIIGRAVRPVFDPVRQEARFAPGDTVTFVPVTASPTHATPRPPEPAVTGGRRVTILNPGLFTTVQDQGVWGHHNVGCPVSGAMDPVSHALANLLVGNDRDARALEATIAGPELRVEQDTMIAVAGANLSPTLDGAPVPLLTAIRARAGAVLRFGNRLNGARAYVAFAGGIAGSPRWPVRRLDAGAVLSLLPADAMRPRTAPDAAVRTPAGAHLRVLRGPQDDDAPRGCFQALLSRRFIISPQSDRMGYRLTGAKVPAPGGEMISDATFAGAIQVPPSGDPILLMADRQTTGGYAQVATVISADLPLAAQLAPGDWIEFVECSRADAIAALAAQEAMIRAVR